jgi:hypothetical protein
MFRGAPLAGVNNSLANGERPIYHGENSMRETVEFRIPGENADQYLGPSDGVCLGQFGTRKIDVDVRDPLFSRIKELDSEFRKKGKSFFFGWKIRRRYTKSELVAAEAFLVIIKHFFEPAGEECGTIYDDSTACEFCGAGATRKTDLILPSKRLPKPEKLAFAETIAGERIVSTLFVEVFQSHHFRGAEFRSVKTKTNPSIPSVGWYELIMNLDPVGIVAPTQAGIDVFDNGSEPPPNSAEIAEELKLESWCDKHAQYRCPRGHTIGLNLISELSLRRGDFNGHDIAYTTQQVGVRRGLLRPGPLLIISPRLWRVIKENGLKGAAFEIAHLR